VLWLRIDKDCHKNLFKASAPSWTYLEKEADRKDLFFFEEGVVVGWGKFSQEQEEDLIVGVSPSEVQPYREPTREWMNVEYIEESSRVDTHRDLILVSKFGNQDKLAFSHGIARSVKLHALENSFADTIALIGDTPKYLEKVQLPPQLADQEGVYSYIAKILRWKQLVTVNLAMLEPPDYLWDAPKQEKLYEQIERHLDLTYRVNIINKKLDICFSHLEVLREKLAAAKEHFANTAIIAFIALSVFFTALEKTQKWKDFTFEDLIASIKERIPL